MLPSPIDGALFGNKDWTSGGNVGWLFVPSRVNSLNYSCVGGPRRDIGGVGTLDGQRHRVAATFDREANRVFYYIDGSLVATNNLSATGAESLTPAAISTTLIGGSGNGRYSGAGIIDDVGIWARPLDAQEILAIYVQGLNSQPLTTASTGAIAPLIVAQPRSETRVEGLPTGFSVAAVGTSPLAYQWRKNGAAPTPTRTRAAARPRAPGTSRSGLPARPARVSRPARPTPPAPA